MDPFYPQLRRLTGTFFLVCLSWFAMDGLFAQTPMNSNPSNHPIDVTLGDRQPAPSVNCPADEDLNDLIQSKGRSFQRFEEAVRAQINRDRFVVYHGQRPAEAVWTLPVVMHVLHNGERVGEEFNLGYDQLSSALNALNKDFANGQGLDTGIRFDWARRDPSGQPATGVVRELVGELTADEADKWMADKAWDPERYINIFILPEAGDWGWKGRTVGASMETAPLGIIVRSRAFGTVNWVDAWTSDNRTLTHQMGHYLGLRHVYSSIDDGSSSCLGMGDGVCDTPRSGKHTTCEPLADYPEADLHNHMDDAPGVCRSHFTPGQKERMRATIQAILSGLLTAETTEPLASLDGAITEVGVRDLECSPEGYPWVELANLGVVSIDSAIIRLQLNSREVYPVYWKGHLRPGERIRIEAPKMAFGYGPFAVSAELELPVENGRNTAQTDNPFHQLEGWLQNNSYVHAGENLPGNRLEFVLTPDAYGDEISWTVLDQNGMEWARSSAYPLGKSGIPVIQSACVQAGCYRLELNDAGGDGLNAASTWYELKSGNGDVLASGNGSYGSGIKADFCVAYIEPNACMDANLNGVCDAYEQEGCTDALGCNYDPKATYLSECEFPEYGRDCAGECLGDQDEDGICDQLEWVGCQDRAACNYDEKATDPGPCEYSNCNEAAEGISGDLESGRNIKLYPNPSMEQPPVWTIEGFEREGMRARLFSPSGVLVWESVTERESDGRHRLRTNTWIASGAYILELSAADYEYPVAPSVVHVRVR